jgi:hypothetical protein
MKEAPTSAMDRKQQDLLMALCCAFFLFVSLAGAAVVVTGQVAGVDGLLLLMLSGGMALLFAWLTFSALQGAGLFGARRAEEPAPAASPSPSPAPSAPANTAPAAKVEGK